MLPSVLAGQLQKGLADYIETTFPITNPSFQGIMGKMLKTQGAVFHEPYAAVRLPFRVADGIPDYFTAIHPEYEPYVHQQRAFDRLTGEDGRSTLIATGTGSGKTECFLYPILEYCYRHRGEKGIKALIIYPMNALASDQAQRIARLIYNSSELKGNITAGMYVGGYETSPSRGMSEEQVITDHETMLNSPPDILLTNYKMLDYLLVRPKDAALWQENRPETMKYIAVDELHTFDGAQGTDLACLLRRLKARLYTPPGFLCCIGTSATMGAKDSSEGMRQYASEVFGEMFETDCVIVEDRLSPAEFFEGHDIHDFSVPKDNQVAGLKVNVEADDLDAYLVAAAGCWFDASFDIADVLSEHGRLALSEHFMHHGFTRDLLANTAGQYFQPSILCDELKQAYPLLGELTQPELALDALLALISHARTGDEGKTRPFLNVHVQVWMRELRRFLARVSGEDITCALASDLNDQQARQYLPIVNCRDCGETGWVSLTNERGNLTLADLNTFYNLYFKNDQKVTMLFPHSHAHIPYKMSPANFCPACLQLNLSNGPHVHCSSCGSETISVIFPTSISTSGPKGSQQYICPFCSSRRGLSIVGLRSATAISAVVSQMFASKFNDDKKTLAFSDNVQDAAHRAGFFNARTWKFGLRSAIERFSLVEGEGLSLREFSDQFVEFWKSKLSPEEFTSLFIAPNMTWMRAYEKMRNEGHLGSDSQARKLLSDIEKRLQYEIMLEYGLNCRIGRTLEKSGCSTIAYNSFNIAEVADIVRTRATNELGVLKNSDDLIFQRMVLGFLHVMRLNGAFNDPVFHLFTSNDGKNYLLSNDWERWLPGLQSGRNTPRFIGKPVGNGRRSFNFDLVAHSRYAHWIGYCVDEVITDDSLEQLSEIVFNELLKSGYIVPLPSSAAYSVWGLDKEQLFVSNNVVQLACDCCGNQVSVALENLSIWENAPCLRSKCDGHLEISEHGSLDYYGRLYSGGDMVRILAREHTGLLGRDDREELERVFKRDSYNKKPWDANLLSCTPTLEMGIDIGDLSTVVLCSIPPAQAQFLQRAGRAGRKDGNALTIAVANARPHDLYFYADPMEMISGIVEPPHVFLRASAVLERQFVAYCMDCWIKRGVPDKAIPPNIGVCVKSLPKRLNDMFPFNFLIFVQDNLSSLLRTFIQMFSQDLDQGSIDELRVYAQGDRLAESPMHVKILEAFESLKSQRDALLSSIKQLKKLIKDVESKPQDSSHDEEIKELKSELNALKNVVKSLEGKDVFNFMSDEGLLPNYAFPEAGIVLKAILFRKEDSESDKPSEGGKRKYEKMVYEYNRSASSALSEFAPSNNFYVDGRKLTVNQVDLTTAQAAKWRLCPSCSHAQIEESGKNAAACPYCGSPAWADTGQIRTMLKVQMVYSNMDYTKSLINDESDDRNSVFYCKQMLVDVNEETDIIKAFRMDNDEFAFGYEFVKKATMREINFGESDIVGERLTVAGVDEVRKGFKVCKYCGKLQFNNGKPEHTFICRAKNMPPGNDDPFEEFLFLYREFATEALRILVPATTMDYSKVRQESFIAAFMLGMKQYFGNVDHLRACLSEVPVPEADYRKQYLVIYDSVPGGTGYLKQLMQQENSLTDIFEKALEVLENCTCKNDPQKDGCYHCLFAYRQSQNIGQISRATAIRLLKLIMSGRTSLTEIPKLGNVPTNGLFESELERRFIEALAQMGNDSRTINITKELVNNKEGYLLKVGDLVWEVEPQVVMDSALGVSVQSRADFVLRPMRPIEGQKPVAIFTDGFKYHEERVADDTLKREAIRRSGAFRVWVLSWKDVQSVFQVQPDYATATLIPQNMPSGAVMYKPIVENGNAQNLHPDKAGTFELLVQYLENRDAERLFGVHAIAYAMSLLDKRNMSIEMLYNEWRYLIEPILDELNMRESLMEFRKTIFGKWIPRTSNPHLKILAGVDIEDFRANKTNAEINVCALLDDVAASRTDKYEPEWNGFWQFFNVMQFVPGFVAVTEEGMNNSIYSAIPSPKQLPTKASFRPGSVDEGWNDIIGQLYDDIARECARQLMDAGVSAPSAAGYELVDSRGSIVAECEMAWEDLQIALLLPEQTDNREAFIEQGWIVIAPRDSDMVDILLGRAER